MKTKALSDYIHERANLPAGAELRLVSSDVVTSCYRELRFRTKVNGRTVDLVAFLSADQRFLSRDLVDTETALQALSKRRVARQKAADFDSELMKGDLPTRGAVGAPITIIVFSDFQSEYSKLQARILKDGFRASELRMVFRNLPSLKDTWSKKAAEMARCVYEQSSEAFWELHDAFFQANVTSDNLVDFVEEVIRGNAAVSEDVYHTCLRTKGGVQQIDKDAAFATTYEVRSTPTLFLNGRQVSGVMSAEDIRALARAPATEGH